MSKFIIVCPNCGEEPYINEENGISYLAKTCPKCIANVFDFEIKLMATSNKKEKETK